MAKLIQFRKGQTLYQKAPYGRKGERNYKIDFIRVFILDVHPEKMEITASIGGGPAMRYPFSKASRWVTEKT